MTPSKTQPIVRTLKLAGRKWRRQFQEAVRLSLAKTITEPVTNAYDSYKRMYGAADRTTGLIDALLQLKAGDHVLHDELAGSLPKRPRRRIIVRVNRTKTASMGRRGCQVLDAAEGMSFADLDEKFELYGSEKSGLEEGHAVRGLFGQGLLDVMFSHSPGALRTVRDGSAAEARFTWVDEEPKVEIEDFGSAGNKLRDSWGIAGNGTLTSFQLDENCRVPHSSEILVARLSNFYMLRLIAADPACEVTVEQIRHGGIETDALRYNLPRGQVIARFNASVPFENFTPIAADCLLVRADASLPGREAGDERASGLLVVDETDAVLDQTMFRFDGSPLLDNLYGVLRLTGVREILKAKLDANEALLTESRDGFDQRKGLYQALDLAIAPILAPYVQAEVERRSARAGNVSEASARKIRRAFEKLNTLFEDVTKQQAPGIGVGGRGVVVPDEIDFDSENIQLVAGVPRRLRILANKSRFKEGATVIVDSDTDAIQVEPTSLALEPIAGPVNALAAYVRVLSSQVGANATITAVSEDIDGDSAEASLIVADVRMPELLEPPAAGLDFAPPQATAAPSRRGTLSLIINAALIPAGTPILIRHAGGDASVKLVDHLGDDQEQIEIRVRDSDLLPGKTVARINLNFRGYGFGQRAKFRATTFVRKVEYKAEAQVRIQEAPSPKGGIYKDAIYGDLTGSFSQSAGEFDPITGFITINRLHPINRAALGADQAAYASAIESDPRAQTRLADVIIDTCLYHTAAVAYENNQLPLPYNDLIGGLRRWVDQFKYEYAEAVYREIVSGYSVPRIRDVAAPAHAPVSKQTDKARKSRK